MTRTSDSNISDGADLFGACVEVDGCKTRGLRLEVSVTLNSMLQNRLLFDG